MSLPPSVMSRKHPLSFDSPYKSGFRNPTGGLPFLASFWLNRAISPAHSGATALVPPITPFFPPTSRTWYPVAGSASPLTSGTPRPVLPLGFWGPLALAWSAGRGKSMLTPPPVPASPWFQTVSLEMVEPDPSSLVPPHARANGLDAG